MSEPAATIVLLGASTRAAAVSALRAGWTAWCADLYADADLRRIALARKVPLDAYPHGLIDALADAPPAPVIYTGALENRPDLIARIEQPVWGNAPHTLRALRTPSLWSECLRAAGIACPSLAASPPADGRWLLKPRRSAGGLGIHPYTGQTFDPGTHFLQEQIEGEPTSALFLGHEDRATLLGVTAQLIGVPWLNASGFHYAGNIGPLPLEPATITRWRQLGAALTRTFALRGLFGVDAIERDGVPFTVEINPRYTASVEVLERSYQQAFLPWHRAAFVGHPACPDSQSARGHTGTPRVCGKAILYARASFAFPPRGPWEAALGAGVDLDQTDYADIPHPGELIRQGQPLLTIFASGASTSACLAALQEKATDLDRRLWG